MKCNTAKARLDGNNPICKAIHDRVMELIPLGIADIWMRNDGEDAEFHLVTVLGIDRQRWDLAAPLTGLFKADGSINFTQWKSKLGLQIASENFQTRESGGNRNHSLWFRFLGDSQPVVVQGPAETVVHSSRRHSQMSPADIKLNTSRALTPKSEQSVLLLGRFYDDSGKCGKLRPNIFHQPEVVAFLSDKEKEASNADREIVDDSSPMDITDHSASSIGSSSSTCDE